MNREIRVAMVDDNACMVWGVKHLIAAQNRGMEFVGAISRSSEVAAALEELRPDVVLLEIQVDEAQGSLELIRLVGERCSARVLVLTAERDASVHEKAILAGARGLLLKSEPVEVVLRAIEAVHAGEVWLKRELTGKIIAMMAAAYRQSPEAEQGSQFTPSENRVIAAAVRYRGAPNKVIADTLNMSPNTFRNHLSSIYTKLGIHRRLDLVLYGIKHGAAEQAVEQWSGARHRDTDRPDRAPGAREDPRQLGSSLRTMQKYIPAGADCGLLSQAQAMRPAVGVRLVKPSLRPVGTSSETRR